MDLSQKSGDGRLGDWMKFQCSATFLFGESATVIDIDKTLLYIVVVVYFFGIQSNDKLMPNSCLGQNLLVNHHGIAVSRNSCLSHNYPNLKTPWNRVCIRRMFPHLGKSNARKNPSTVAFYVHVSGVEKYLPLRSADFFALLTLLALLLSSISGFALPSVIHNNQPFL